MHIDLIVPYANSIRKKQPCGAVIKKYVRLAWITMIDTSTGWYKIAKVPFFELDEVARRKCEYIDKSSARVMQMLNHTWLYRYPRQDKVFFGNGSKFKSDFNHLLNQSSIMLIWTPIENPQGSAPVERIHWLIYYRLVTRDIDSKVYDI